MTETVPQLDKDETQKLIAWAAEIDASDATYFEKGAAFARRLGAYYRPDGLTEIGFWTPELTREAIRPRAIYLEVFTPLDPVDWFAKERTTRFSRHRLQLRQQGEYFWGVISGLQAGTRDRAGSFYWLRYVDRQDCVQTVRDVVPYSLPFGVFAPAEVYDIDSLQKQRQDLEYFQRTGIPESRSEIPRVAAPTNILQMHVGTATPEGTFAGLTQLYRRLNEKLERGETLTPSEQNYVGYDAIQLLPIEPTIEFRSDYSFESEFFRFSDPDDGRIEEVPPREIEITLRNPNTQDWGYDVPILGSSAVNSAFLASLRPDEAIEFIETLHEFSTGPILVIYDLVYGHADNQSELLLNRQYMKGPNMYGQDLNHQLPAVRAIFLEMQRRKINTGADGIRIDGGQDFRFFNPLSGRVEQDDAYLLKMSDVVQAIDGNQRLLFTIFEDGRPWPKPGWEETSTYRDLIELRPDSYQWGPLIFAHNTPALKGFWDKKWRRVCEVMFGGDRWITGCANHDTIRRGNQIDLQGEINWNLGETLPAVLQNAYDNPAMMLWVYGFAPGLPMDFINALMRSPWMFFRNTDDRYGVKVVSEEIGFLDWQVSPQLYDKPGNFKRLKALGFENLEQLKEFGRALQNAMMESDYDLKIVARACQMCLGDTTESCDLELLKKLNRPGMIAFLKSLDVPQLKKFALEFMEDCYDVCNVAQTQDEVDAGRSQFNLNVRQFRHQRSWLAENLKGTDRFDRLSNETQTLFYGVRSHPKQESDRVAMVAHFGGEPTTATLGEWLDLDLSEWQVAIASPGLELDDLNSVVLSDTQGFLLVPSNIEK